MQLLGAEKPDPRKSADHLERSASCAQTAQVKAFILAMENNLYRDAECTLCGWRWTWEDETVCPECESKKWSFMPESKVKKDQRLKRVEEEKSYR